MNTETFTPAEKFEAAFLAFFEGCQMIYRQHMAEVHQNYQLLDAFTYKTGSRYWKVIRGNSVHCFVDSTNGDVLKAASWKAPAKGARGNIFDDKHGLGRMGEYGPAYNK